MSLLSTLPPHGPARERAVAEAIAAGRLDPVTWVPVRCGPVELQVSADWLTIDGHRIPMSAANAQRAVDALGAVLPTPKVVRAIEAAAREGGRIVPFVPWPRWEDDSQLATSTILWRERNIDDVPPGTLIAGALKDVVLAPRVAWMPGRVLLFGGLYVNGQRVQDLQTNASAHEASFDGGYAHGVRAVLDACTVHGAPARVSELYRDDTLSAWLSDEGPLSVLRYPIPAPPPLSGPTGPRVLRRGMRGEDVRELQGLLGAKGYVLARDGIFGPATEAAVRDWQEAAGLVVDGLAGPTTMASLHKESSPDHKDPSARGTGVAALEVALAELAAGAREQPAWSNTGPRIRQYLAGCVRDVDRDGDLDRLGLTTAEWCAAFVGWCDAQAGVPRTWRAAVWELCADARAAGALRGLDYQPRPGDLAVFARAGQDPRRGGLGHVARVERFEPGRLTTIDGNHGDRVARVERPLPDPALVAWIEYPGSS